MRILEYDELAQTEIDALMRRPSSDFTDIDDDVRSILKTVQNEGDSGVKELLRTFDKVELSSLAVSDQELQTASTQTTKTIREAVKRAGESLNTFHSLQRPSNIEVETAPGVRCRLDWRAIDRVGLYVPGGSAPLISTVLMLGIPAKLAGCPRIVLCTPPNSDGSISTDILFAAHFLGIRDVFKVGGGQAIAAMALGTQSIPKVSKIFGPGNRYVTAMKSLVSRPPLNTAVDMLAGPSELLVIADEIATPQWIAADLLSQAEHGADSPVVLVTTSAKLVEAVKSELAAQLEKLPRKAVAGRALDRSFMVLVKDLEQAIDFSNAYAPEHLILAVKDANTVSSRIVNAGSVFIGPMTSVVFGDYASGTNHTLPTGGLSVSFGGLTVTDFMKPMFFQEVGSQGLASLASTVKALARAEKLEAHARAVEVREAGA